MSEPASADSRLQLRLSADLLTVAVATADENEETVADLCRRAIAIECGRPELAGVRERGRPTLPVTIDESDDKVVIVPARKAWLYYNRKYSTFPFSIYVCQNNRRFRQNPKRFAFYCDQEIKQPIPKILDQFDDVKTFPGANTGMLDIVVRELLGIGYPFDRYNSVYFLSPIDSPETVSLEKAIPNDVMDKNGVITAFVQSQRYATLNELKAAQTTSDLE